MTALQWIVKEAKKLKKEYPKRFSTWREYVAQASAIYAKKHKGKSPVGKKRSISGTTKRKVVKKAAKKVAKKAVKKETVRNYGSHKDTQSHNVKINVTSGIGSIVKSLTHKYGVLSAKKLIEKTKRGKKVLQKEMTDVSRKIKKLKNL